MTHSNAAGNDGKNLGRPSAPLFFQQRFFPMWTALALGAFTDNMLKQALSIALVYSIFTAPLISNDDALPIVGSLFPIAMLIFSSLAGQVADKYETALMFRRTKLAEFALMVLAAIGFMTKSTLILVLALFLMGAQSAFFSPSRTGAMPKYLQPDELVRGNALCSGGLFVSVMLGILIGGLLIAMPNGPMLVSIILVSAAFIGWRVILLAPEAAANAPDLKIDWNIFRQTFVLFGFAFRSPGVAHPVFGVAVYWLLGAFVSVATPLFVRDTLIADETVVTTLMGLFAIGAALGAGIASSLAKGKSGLRYSFGAAVIASISTMIVFSISISAPYAAGDLRNFSVFFSEWRAFVIAAGFLAASTAMSVFAVPMMAAVQRRAPSDRRSRILAANNMLNGAGAIIGSWLVFSITRTQLSAAYVFLAVASAQGLIAMYMLYRRSRVPEGLYDESLNPNNQANNADITPEHS